LVGHIVAPGLESAQAVLVLETHALFKGIRASHAGQNLHSLLGILNQAIFSHRQGKVGLILTAAELDLSTGMLTIVNAGGEPPLLVPHDRTAHASGPPGPQVLAAVDNPALKAKSDTLGLQVKADWP